MFLLPFSNLNFVLIQEKEIILTRLMSARHVKDKMFWPSQKEPVHAMLSSVKKARVVQRANVVLLKDIAMKMPFAKKDLVA
jgi:hypothetical protein